MISSMHVNPFQQAISVHWQTGAMEGREVKESRKLLGDLKGIFLDEAARASSRCEYCGVSREVVSAGRAG